MSKSKRSTRSLPAPVPVDPFIFLPPGTEVRLRSTSTTRVRMPEAIDSKGIVVEIVRTYERPIGPRDRDYKDMIAPLFEPYAIVAFKGRPPESVWVEEIEAV